MESALADCERRFGPRAKILDHPFIGPLTRPMSGASFTGFMGGITQNKFASAPPFRSKREDRR